MAKDIKHAGKALEDFFSKVIKDEIVEASVELFNEVVQRTPLDTGAARKSWQITTNSVPTNISESNNIQLSVEREDDVVFITSNIEYMEKLNAGHSGQAEANFIEHSIAVVANNRRK